MQQILIIGKERQLGTSFYELCRHVSWVVFSFTTEKNLNLTDDNDIHRFFSDKKFDFISNEAEFIPGIYHYSNEGVCSWYDFAAVVFDKAGINCKLIPVESDKFPTPASRPYYSVMDKSLIKELYGIEIPYWQKSLTRCLQDFKSGVRCSFIQN